MIGAAAMAEGLVARIKNELGKLMPRVIATGGQQRGGAIDRYADVTDNQLHLRGIREIIVTTEYDTS